MSATDPITPEPRRFSIRLPRPMWIGLAAAVLVVVAIGFRNGLPIYRQHVAIGEIEQVRGYVATEPRGPAWLHAVVGEEWMKRFDTVNWVALDGRPASDATLCNVGCLTELRELWLHNTQLTDEGLAHLKGLKKLERLWLDDTQVTDAGLVHLKGMTRLQRLHVKNTEVTDVGIGDLQRALPGLVIER